VILIGYYMDKLLRTKYVTVFAFVTETSSIAEKIIDLQGDRTPITSTTFRYTNYKTKQSGPIRLIM